MHGTQVMRQAGRKRHAERICSQPSAGALFFNGLECVFACPGIVDRRVSGLRLMDAQRWQLVREIFESLLDLDETARALRLTDIAATDPAMAKEVRDLLTADVHSSGEATALASSAGEFLDDLLDSEDRTEQANWQGRLLGPWKLEHEIGRGGMGAVWLASRADGAYQGQVAIKLMRTSLDGEELRRRFQAERQILAGFDHPNIARLVDAGTDAEGRHYLALEYVDGEDIVHYCNSRKLSVEQRIGIFLEVCSAVAHAHQRLVVHRDLKPQNILVTAEGRVRLLDFGIAKLIETGSDDTQTAGQVFTTAYAAPEQLTGQPVGVATDVYQLGLLLYQLLTGRLPHASRSGAADRALSDVIFTAPVPASAALERSTLPVEERHRIATERGLRFEDLRNRLKGDLDAILLRILRTDPAERYASVEAMVEDIERYRQHQPVRARKGTRRYLIGRFISRHRLPVVSGFLLLLALTGGLLVALLQARQIAAERDRADGERQLAVASLAFYQEIFRLGNPQFHGGSKPQLGNLLDIGERLLLELREEAPPAVQARLLEQVAHARAGIGDTDGARRLWQNSVEIFHGLGDPDGEVRARLQLGLLELRLGNPFDPLELVPADSGVTPATLAAMHVLRAIGLARFPEGREEALGELDRAADLYRKSARVPTPAVVRWLQEARDRFERDGDVSELVALSERRLEQLESIFGGTVAAETFVYLHLVRMALVSRKGERADELAQRFLALRLEGAGPDTLPVAVALELRARVDLALGRQGPAQSRMEEALAIRMQQAGPDHPYTRAASARLETLRQEAHERPDGRPPPPQGGQ
jgi:hypothetical protein